MSAMRSWYFLGHVAVSAPEEAAAVVAIGASTTDGNGSTVDANARWPDYLARRLAAQNVRMGVLNVGIGGNRVLGAGSVTERFARDVLAQPGVTHVIVLSPLNDIRTAGQNPTPSADDLIAGYRQVISQAHAKNLKIYGATLMPFGGDGAWTKEGEAKRQAINQWMRTRKEYDAVFDFDAVLRDPHDPAKMQAKFDSGDHLHPNDAGYEALASVIDISLLKPGQRTRQTAAAGAR
jgi:lysophospholipase L1-like esterase